LIKKFPTVWEKNARKPQGGIFFDSHCREMQLQNRFSMPEFSWNPHIKEAELSFKKQILSVAHL